MNAFGMDGTWAVLSREGHLAALLKIKFSSFVKFAGTRILPSPANYRQHDLKSNIQVL
jgi:hypothetical protein